MKSLFLFIAEYHFPTTSGSVFNIIRCVSLLGTYFLSVCLSAAVPLKGVV